MVQLKSLKNNKPNPNPADGKKTIIKIKTEINVITPRNTENQNI